MAVVFDEVVGTVEPNPATDSADASAPAEGGGVDDPQELRRELKRLAVRRARLWAD
jgi:hypothetical protein